VSRQAGRPNRSRLRALPLCCSNSASTTSSICPALPTHASDAQPTGCRPRATAPLANSRPSTDCSRNRHVRADLRRRPPLEVSHHAGRGLGRLARRTRRDGVVSSRSVGDQVGLQSTRHMPSEAVNEVIRGPVALQAPHSHAYVELVETRAAPSYEGCGLGGASTATSVAMVPGTSAADGAAARL
jgi:hypothetical protein